MKKYFVVADIHSYYNKLTEALDSQGFDINNPDHIFVSLGDLLDRGDNPLPCLQFVNAIPEQRKILVRGNHEDLLEQCFFREKFRWQDISNGTVTTVRLLAGCTKSEFSQNYRRYIAQVRNLEALGVYYDSLVDYAQVGDYVFVHGWIPTARHSPGRDWRRGDWAQARWYNGMQQWQHGVRLKGKTIVCGHWHTSWGHARLQKQGTEFGPDADFSPFVAPGILAIDACTAFSGRVNCVVLKID